MIYSENTADHLDHVRTVLQTLRENKLIAKLSKCAFFFKKLKFLGFVITPEGVETDPEKIKVIKDWPKPYYKRGTILLRVNMFLQKIY